MSHVVLTCTCRSTETCPVPGHGFVLPDPIDPDLLPEAIMAAFVHLDNAVQEVIKARREWVSRGLPADNPFPASLDRLAETMTADNNRLRDGARAAETVARRRNP